MMTDGERDQRIEQLERIERAHPEAVAHERAMLRHAETKLADAIADSAEIKAKWEAFSPHCDQALRDGLLTSELYDSIAKKRRGMYDPCAVPSLEMAVEDARTALYAELVRMEAGHRQTTAAAPHP